MAKAAATAATTATTAATKAAAENSESEDIDNNSDIMSVSDADSDSESDVDAHDFNDSSAKKVTAIGQDEEDDDEQDEQDEHEHEHEHGHEHEQELDDDIDDANRDATMANEFGQSDEEEDDEEDDDDEAEDDDDDENCLQKLDDVTRQNLIADYHPETITHPAAEIQCWACVTRDKYGDIVDELHQTTALMSKFERTRVLGLRTRQLNAGALPFIDVPRTIMSNYLIATMELEQKKLPFIIQRPLPNGRFEYWNVNDLELI